MIDVTVPRELLTDLRDLAFDEIERHRQAMAGRRQARQELMDSVLARVDAILAQQPASVADEREAFEGSIKSRSTDRYPNGSYIDPFVSGAWCGWQARAKLAAPGSNE